MTKTKRRTRTARKKRPSRSRSNSTVSPLAWSSSPSSPASTTVCRHQEPRVLRLGSAVRNGRLGPAVQPARTAVVGGAIRSHDQEGPTVHARRVRLRPGRGRRKDRRHEAAGRDLRRRHRRTPGTRPLGVQGGVGSRHRRDRATRGVDPDLPRGLASHAGFLLGSGSGRRRLGSGAGPVRHAASTSGHTRRSERPDG